MNVTTQDIENYFASEKQRLSNREEYNIGAQRANRTKQIERDFAREHVTYCKKNALSKDDLSYRDLDLQELSSLSSQQFYNPQVVQAMSCVLDLTFYPMPHGHGSATINAYTKASITNLRRIGSESAFGYAIAGGVDKVDNLYVVKIPRTDSSIVDLLHEYYVGVTAINKMREKNVPNFSTVYGMIECGRPQIDPDTKKVLQWCSPTDTHKVPYVLYENIFPSVSAREYCATATLNQFLSMYLQKVCAGYVAATEIGFTHYDDHTENTLMRDVKATGVGNFFQIPYVISDKTYYVGADRLATYIDYGMATVKSNGDLIGVPESQPELAGRYSGLTFPLHDAYKFLLFCAMDVIESTNPNKQALLENIQRIFTFWNKTESITDVVSSQWNNRFALPYNDETRNHTMVELLNHILKVCNTKSVFSSVVNPNYKTLECSKCYTLDSIYRKIGARRTFEVPTTFKGFFDVGYYISIQHPSTYTAMKDKFAYDDAKTQYLEEFNELLSSIRDLLDKIRVDSLSNLALQGTLEQVQKYHYKLFEVVSLLEELRYTMEIGAWIALVFKDSDLTRLLKEKDEERLSFASRMCTLVTQASNNQNEIAKFVSSRDFEQRVKRNKWMSWYKINSPDIIGLQDKVCYYQETDNSDLVNPVFYSGKVYLDNMKPDSNCKSCTVVRDVHPTEVTYSRGVVIIPEYAQSPTTNNKTRRLSNRKYDDANQTRLFEEKYGSV